MRRNHCWTVSISCLAFLWTSFLGIQLSASGLPPIIRGATSKNGQFLVVASLELGPEEQGGARAILSETLEVNVRETFANTKGKLTAPNTYFQSDFGWKVHLPSQPGFLAPWPIISDDGSILALVGVSPPVLGQTLLAIYKRKGKEGILLRNYKVDNLWNLKPGEEKMSGYVDGTPEWFDDGVFSFTDDGAALLYIDKKHGSLQFSLEDGAVTKL